MIRTAKKIQNAIDGAKNILLIPHQKPDGDALGSLTAMHRFLLNRGKNIDTYCKTNYSETFNFLPGLKYLTSEEALWQKKTFDLIILFDSGDLRYAGVDTLITEHAPHTPIINIDHHATNTNYGMLNYVDTNASSTCEMIYRLLTSLREKIDRDMATCLLTGILTDTDNFTNGATNTLSLQASGHLVHLGGDMDIIRRRVFRNQSIQSLRAWGEVLSRLTRHSEYDIVYTYVTLSDIEKYTIEHHHTEGIANFMNNLGEGRAACVFKETPEGDIKGSLRTTRNDTDVSAWAKRLGGGGHKKAAGFTVSGTLAGALEQLLHSISLDNSPTIDI